MQPVQPTAAPARPRPRLRISPAYLALLLLLVIAGCGSRSDSTTAGATPTANAPSTVSMDPSMDPNMDMSTHSPSGSAKAVASVEVFVTIKNKKVTPPTHRLKVPKGKTVRLVVTSDKFEEVHVHGYDKKAVVAAGKPAPVEFVADQAGVFEVELEKQGIQILQVEVT